MFVEVIGDQTTDSYSKSGRTYVMKQVNISLSLLPSKVLKSYHTIPYQIVIFKTFYALKMKYSFKFVKCMNIKRVSDV